jgi:leucyl/phenylalanyl-tRNA---protein transferase
MDIIGVTREMTADLVERAYRTGVFPMAAPEHGVITWHRPDPRAIIPLEDFHVPRRLARTMRSGRFRVTFDNAFAAVMRGCAAGRPVWISEDFHRIYGDLHQQGKAHSVEVWSADELVGGVYGVHVGAAFFAESKFRRARDASKVALAALAQRLRERDFALLEVQYLTEHLAQFGAVTVPDREYVRLLRAALAVDRPFA